MQAEALKSTELKSIQSIVCNATLLGEQKLLITSTTGREDQKFFFFLKAGLLKACEHLNNESESLLSLSISVIPG